MRGLAVLDVGALYVLVCLAVIKRFTSKINLSVYIQSGLSASKPEAPSMKAKLAKSVVYFAFIFSIL